MTGMPPIVAEHFTTILYEILDETFESHHGIYLDRGTSLFETLAEVSADEASRPVSARCASIAAQVAHVCFYMDVLGRYLGGLEDEKVDWDESWRQGPVNADEWAALQQRLDETYRRLLATMRGFSQWREEPEIGGAVAIAIHTAYHLGEIRQALCTIKG